MMHGDGGERETTLHRALMSCHFVDVGRLNAIRSLTGMIERWGFNRMDFFVKRDESRWINVQKLTVVIKGDDL